MRIADMIHFEPRLDAEPRRCLSVLQPNGNAT